MDLWNTKTIKRIFGRWKMLGKSPRETDFPLVKMASVVHYTQWESSRLALWSTRVIGSYVVKKKMSELRLLKTVQRSIKKKVRTELLVFVLLELLQKQPNVWSAEYEGM